MKNNSTTNKKSWKPTAERFVCFLDIMGFKDMVMRNSHEDIYKMLDDFSKKKNLLNNIQDLPHRYEPDSLKTVSFSDAIVIFTKEDTKECLELLTIAVSWLFAQAIESGIPMKGAVAHGRMSINISQQIFFGQPLIDAFLLQEDTEFYGIIVHNTVEKTLNKLNSSLKGYDRYRDCKAHLKSGKIKHYVLDWVSAIKTADGQSLKDKAFLLMKKQREQTVGKPRKYIDNTIDVIEQLYK